MMAIDSAVLALRLYIVVVAVIVVLAKRSVAHRLSADIERKMSVFVWRWLGGLEKTKCTTSQLIMPETFAYSIINNINLCN